MPKVRIDDSLEMSYEDQDFTDPWRTADAVVMHHGQAKTNKLWYRWVPELSRQYRVIRMDARGYGQSTVPAPGYPWSLSNFASDIKSLLDKLGLEKVHLIGETVGGTISMQFAYMYPERLKSVTICSSPYKFVGESSYVENRDMVAREGVEPWVRKEMSRRAAGATDHGYVEWYAQQMIPTAQHVVVETLTYLSTVDLTDILRQIKVLALVLVSEGEHKANPERADGLKRLIPNSRVEVLAGTAGFVQHTSPERCAALWREFVGTLG